MSYITKQSLLVYDFLKSNPDQHFSAEEVYFALISNGDNIGRTTVYRQLDKLCDERKARKFFHGDNNACCYQLESERCHNHYHLKCSSCGTLIHTECDFLDKLSSHIFNDHQFKIDGSRTVLYGICEHCGKERAI
ncbi:MAG: transcriptional repressor [Clostridia bacterium]|nr:transcriptional repressor [Clostridia bacterium]